MKIFLVYLWKGSRSRKKSTYHSDERWVPKAKKVPYAYPFIAFLRLGNKGPCLNIITRIFLRYQDKGLIGKRYG
jgi:hypothetical protein